MRVAPIQASGLAGGGIGVVPGSFKDRVLRRFAAEFSDSCCVSGVPTGRGILFVRPPATRSGGLLSVIPTGRKPRTRDESWRRANRLRCLHSLPV